LCYFRIFRNHGANERDDKKDVKGASSSSGGGIGSFFNWGDGKKDEKKKPLTEKELAERRLAALTNAVDIENDILRIPYFDQHPQGVSLSIFASDQFNHFIFKSFSEQVCCLSSHDAISSEAIPSACCSLCAPWAVKPTPLRLCRRIYLATCRCAPTSWWKT
jgi:hypothetical protein